jgi:hypothetical protein
MPPPPSKRRAPAPAVWRGAHHHGGERARRLAVAQARSHYLARSAPHASERPRAFAHLVRFASSHVSFAHPVIAQVSPFWTCSSGACRPHVLRLCGRWGSDAHRAYTRAARGRAMQFRKQLSATLGRAQAHDPNLESLFPGYSQAAGCTDLRCSRSRASPSAASGTHPPPGGSTTCEPLREPHTAQARRPTRAWLGAVTSL